MGKKILAILAELVPLEGQKKEHLYCYEVLQRLTSIWLILLRNISVAEKTVENLSSIRMRKMLQYIELHYAEEISLDNLAQSAEISKSEASRCFKSVFETTPYKYVMKYRLQKAAQFLVETNLPISEIALRTGWGGQSYFTKIFREKMDCTPSSYRMKKKSSHSIG